MGGDVHDPASDGAVRRAGPSFSLVTAVAVSATEATHRLLQSEPLQHIDISRTFFACTMAAPTATRLASARSVRFSSIRAIFWLGQCAIAVLPLINHTTPSEFSVHGIVSCLAALVSLPGLAFTTGNLSVDLVRVLLHESEFRCSLLLNTVHWLFVAVAFDFDWRVCVCIIEWWVVQLAFTTDADFRGCAQGLHIRLVASLQTALYLIFSVSGVLPHSFQPVFTLNDRPSSVNDFLQWTAPTLIVLQVKGMYAQRKSQRRAPKTVDKKNPGMSGTAIARCSIVKARLTLAKVGDSDLQPSLDRKHSTENVAIALVRTRTTLQFVDVEKTVVTLPFSVSDDGIPMIPFALLYALGVLSFTSTCIATFLSQIHAVTLPHATVAPAFAVCALVGTAAFSTITAGFYHRHLLRELIGTFDVVFASLQFVVGAVLLCEWFQWDARCINVISWTLWFHWILCFDALTPPVRAYLRLKKLTATPVALFTLYGLSGPFVLLYGYSNTKVVDRVLFGHIRLSTLLLSRVLTLWIWCAHLIWDIGVRADGEFIFLKDSVEYEVPREVLFLASHCHVVSSNAVVPKETTSCLPMPASATSTPAPTPTSSPSLR